MKSTTLRRSNITREKVAMMEALSRYNSQHQDEDFYKAQNKTRELDVLWQSFGVKPQKNEKSLDFLLSLVYNGRVERRLWKVLRAKARGGIFNGIRNAQHGKSKIKIQKRRRKEL